MKRSILDFDQAHMVELGLSAEHLLILDWYRYWRSLDTMRTVERDGRTYAWISHAKLREDMPILGQKSDSGIRKLLQKLVDTGVLDRIQVACKNGRGSRAYYATGVQFVALVSDQRPKRDGENQRPAPETGRSDSPARDIHSPASQETPNGVGVDTELKQRYEALLTEHVPVDAWGNHPKERTQLKKLADNTRRLATVTESVAEAELPSAIVTEYLRMRRDNPKSNYWANAPVTPSGLVARWDAVVASLAEQEHKRREVEEAMQRHKEFMGYG